MRATVETGKVEQQYTGLKWGDDENLSSLVAVTESPLSGNLVALAHSFFFFFVFGQAPG